MTLRRAHLPSVFTLFYFGDEQFVKQVREWPMAQVVAKACNLDTQNILVCNLQARLPLSQRADQLTSQVAHPENNRRVCRQPEA